MSPRACASISAGVAAAIVSAVVLAGAPGRAVAVRGAAAPEPFGVVSSLVETAAYATHFDPLTLKPTGPRVELEEYHDGWSVSPDGRRVAFGKSPAGGNSRDSIRIVDVASVSLEQTALAPAYIGPLGWLAPRVLVGLLEDDRPIVFDPATGDAIRRLAPLRTCGTRPTAVAGGQMLAVEPRAVVAITATGSVRRARFAWLPRDCFRAAIAVDGDRDAAWVASGSHLARFDLRTLRVNTPSLPRPRAGGSADRLTLSAIGNGSLVVTHQSSGGRPRGVELVNPRARTRKVLEAGTGAARVATGFVLTYNGGRPRSVRGADGVRAFDGSGRLRYHVLKGRWISDLEVAGRRAYAFGSGRMWTIEARRGRVLQTSSADRTIAIDLLAG